MAKQAVLLIGDLAHASDEWSALSSKYTLKEFRKGEREQFLSNCKSGEYDDVVALYRSNQSTSETGPFDQELISALPKSLKYICHNGAGYDNIDVASCNERQIGVSSTPVAVDEATADVAVFLMLGALRHAHVPLTALRAGQWRGESQLGHDPKGKTLGILGMGGIGRAFAHRAQAFGLNIIYHNRSQLSSDLEPSYTIYVKTLDELLERSDILSLNLSLNAKTKYIISAAQLKKLKMGSIIVNTARGALINEADLVSALESGHIGSVGLDVFEEEPKIHAGLVKSDKAFLLPHVGTMTWETQRDMELLVLKNLESGVQTGQLLTRVPEQKSFNWVKDGDSALASKI
ncbi:hypothetical protein BT93_L4536 [Corymbia citriodora subsp. variegata]|uniref:Hydroxyphenylpyruvate reductase n=1 Tax=Corymbia citriodora subsp. variegata TaxID=360336 RepID=A0A8T0CGR9_CORYI|nr:hypothetical protein BT93_L4536 [Corymbia citriodora subsp. variegata]